MDEMEGFAIGFALASIVSAFLPNTAVTAAEWGAAAGICENNGGVQYVRGEGAIRSLKVVCNNGVEAQPEVRP